MNKQLQEFLRQPVKTGVLAYVLGAEWETASKVSSVEKNGDIYIKKPNNSTILVKKENYKKSDFYILITE